MSENLKGITKAELRKQMGVSHSYLARQLNVNYYEELKAVGYEKRKHILKPPVYKKFKELWAGEPFKENEK